MRRRNRSSVEGYAADNAHGWLYTNLDVICLYTSRLLPTIKPFTIV